MNRIILTASCLLSGTAILITAFCVHGSTYWGFSRQMKRAAAAELELVAAGIETGEGAYLAALAALPPLSPRITLITADGNVLFDDEYDAENMENHADRPEVRAAFAGKTGEDVRFSRTLAKETYYRARMLRDGSVLRVAVSMDSVIAQALDLLPLTAVIVLVIFLVTLLVAARITRRIIRPINTLNLEKPEESGIYDELSPLLSRIKAQKDQIGEQMEELRKKQLEFEAIVDNMREGFLLLDREGRVISCNASARTLLSAHAALTEQQNVLALRRDEPFRLALDTVLRGMPAEYALSTETSRLRLMASPVLDGTETQGAVLLLLDVTEQEDRERLRREFSANVSHELKTPLTVISGYAELLSEGLVRPEETADCGGKIFHEARRLLNLINDVMQLSRLDEGGPEMTWEEVALLPLAQGVVNRAVPLAEAKHVHVSVTGEDAVIVGVLSVIQEMMFNLVDNAVKYNREYGEASVSITREGEAVRLCVADTGIGIPPAEQERVFERFYRVDKSRNAGTGGTGLGLSIVKHGAQLHHAGITLESDGARGTRISILFPSGGDSPRHG